MKTTVFVIFFTFVVVGVPSTAAADPWAALRAEAAKVKTIQAEFEQKKTLRILKKPLVSRGRFSFAAPGSARWEYTAPLRTVTLVHRGKVKRFAAGRSGKMVADASSNLEAMRVVLEQMTGWLSGKFSESKLFSAELVESDRPDDPAHKPRPKVILRPKDKAMKRFIHKVELQFAQTPGVVGQVTIIEGKGSSTRITFSGVKVNKPLPDDLFVEVK